MTTTSAIQYFEPVGSSFARFASQSGLTARIGHILPGSGITNEVPSHKRAQIG